MQIDSGSRRVYVLTDMMIGILCIASIFLISTFQHLSVLVLILLSVTSGFLSEQGYVSAESLAPKLVDTIHFPKSQSVLESLELLALLFGPCLAGMFIFYFKLESLILVSMVFYFLSALAMKNITVENHQPDFTKSTLNSHHNLTIGFKTILQYPYLMQLMSLAMLINMLFGLMTGSAPVMIAGIYHKTDHYYAILNFSAGMFGVSLIVLFNYLLKYIHITKIGVSTFVLACLSCILLGFTNDYISYVLIYAFFYGVNGLFSIFFRSERARIIPGEILGCTIGAIIFLTFLLFPVSGLLISISQRVLGLQNLIMFFGIFCLILGIPMLIKILNVSKVITQEEYL